MITLDTVYKILREATIAHPIKEVKCLFPQTFGVLGHYSDINTANLGKTLSDYKQGYFFSRKWKVTNQNAASITWDYPLVGVQHYNFVGLNMNTSNSSLCHNLTLGVYDILTDPCQVGLNCQRCANRAQHQIETDTEQILLQIIDYIRIIKKASINGGDEGYYSHRYLDYRISEGDSVKITNHNIQLFKATEPWYGLRADTGIEKVYGTEIKVEVCVKNCVGSDYNFAEVDPLIALQDCCK